MGGVEGERARSLPQDAEIKSLSELPPQVKSAPQRLSTQGPRAQVGNRLPLCSASWSKPCPEHQWWNSELPTAPITSETQPPVLGLLESLHWRMGRKDFGGAVANTHASQRRGPRSDAWLGKKILHVPTKEPHATKKAQCTDKTNKWEGRRDSCGGIQHLLPLSSSSFTSALQPVEKASHNFKFHDIIPTKDV